MSARSHTIAVTAVLLSLCAGVAQSAEQGAIQQNIRQQQSIQAQMQAVPAYCQAKYAKQPAGPSRSQAVQMCMQERYQALSTALQLAQRMMQQLQKTQKQILR
jgi:hypothetical protein